MPETRYKNFDLVVTKEGEEYRVKIDSPDGEASSVLRNPFTQDELDEFYRVVSPSRRARRIDTPEVATAKAFGERLFNSVFTGDSLGLLRASLNNTWHDEEKLRLRLRLAGAPELADLPWEYLYNPSLNRFLALDDDTAIVRYLDMPERVRPVQVALPLNVLVMISNPSSYPRLDVDTEWANLKRSLGDLEQQGLVQVELLESATLPGLSRRLQSKQFHIFHYIGHGGFDERSQEGVLIMQDDYGRAKPVGGQELGWVLHNRRSLCLAILNACEGARADRMDAFSGTAQSLVQQGIPAVVAMQFEITDTAAKSFAHSFYEGIANGHPIEAALTETRLLLFAEGLGLEWGTPVLYMRSPDGRVFELQKGASSPQQPLQQPEPQLYQSQQAAAPPPQVAQSEQLPFAQPQAQSQNMQVRDTTQAPVPSAYEPPRQAPQTTMAQTHVPSVPPVQAPVVAHMPAAERVEQVPLQSMPQAVSAGAYTPSVGGKSAARAFFLELFGFLGVSGFGHRYGGYKKRGTQLLVGRVLLSVMIFGLVIAAYELEYSEEYVVGGLSSINWWLSVYLQMEIFGWYQFDLVGITALVATVGLPLLSAIWAYTAVTKDELSVSRVGGEISAKGKKISRAVMLELVGLFFVGGLGHLYAGYWWRALLVSVVKGFLGYLSISAIIRWTLDNDSKSTLRGDFLILTLLLAIGVGVTFFSTRWLLGLMAKSR